MDNHRLDRRVSQHINFQPSACSRNSICAERLPFDAAYGYARASLFAQALRVTKERAAAEEVVQDVFLYAWQNTESYDERRSSVLTWLTMLCKSRAIDYLRAHASQFRIEIGDLDTTGFESTDLSPELSFETARRSRALKVAIAALLPLQKQAIVLSYYAELSHNEISDHMHIPVGTVKTLIRRSKLNMSENTMLRD